MKTATLDELKQGGDLLKVHEPILVTQLGKPIGFFRPLTFPDESIPLEERRRLFKEKSDEIRRHLDAQGISEEQVDRDIADYFKNRR